MVAIQFCEIDREQITSAATSLIRQLLIKNCTRCITPTLSGVAAAILDLQLKTTSGDVALLLLNTFKKTRLKSARTRLAGANRQTACSTIESGTLENMGIAVGISLIAALELDISWG